MIANIGGIFIYSENPQELAKWYARTLNMIFLFTPQHKACYITYPYNDTQTGKPSYTVFSIIHRQQRPVPQHRLFSVNLRVHKLHELVAHFDNINITYKGIETHPEGNFAWLTDPEGNYIELWEDINSTDN